ncbi:MAG TPA: glutathione transferase GstA [Burkholderiales bacterium]|nr:glutathione transferase GstA [Burkholderiales bacterium]
MKLYYSPGACSLAPHIVLIELSLPHSTVQVDLKAKETADGRDYRQINSKGYVPTLELDDGQYLTEAAVIVQYLADRAPSAALAPAPGTMERYRLQEWLNFISSEIHKGFGPLWNPAASEDEKERARGRLGQRFDWLSAQLANKDYLMGKFSVADAYLFTVLNWTQWHDIDLAKWPALKQYVGRVAARPAVQEALKAEGLAK